MKKSIIHSQALYAAFFLRVNILIGDDEQKVKLEVERWGFSSKAGQMTLAALESFLITSLIKSLQNSFTMLACFQKTRSTCN
jgi:hypothetical protein